MCQVEYPYGHKASLAENYIAENMFSQVYGEGNRHLLFEEIVDNLNDVSEVNQKYYFITTLNGNKLRWEKIKGW